MPVPGFLIVGAPKAGTTALHAALATHPELFMSPVKEPKYFLCQGTPPRYHGPGDARTAAAMVCNRAAYLDLFKNAPPGALCGESTSLYLQDRLAHRRIAAALPGVRLIAVLRDPVDRAHSNWAHLWSAGLEPEGDFLDACALEQVRVAGGWAPFWQYLALGRYGGQLAALYDVIPPERVLLVRYLELREQPRQALQRICAFLGVDQQAVGTIPAQNVTVHTENTWLNRAASRLLRVLDRVGGPQRTALLQPLDAALGRHLQRTQGRRRALAWQQRRILIPRFTDDVHQLQRLTGQDFRDWLDPHRPDQRALLQPAGRIGTAYGSIDRPLDGPGGRD